MYTYIYIYIYIYIYTFARRMLLPYDCWRERWQSRTCQSVGTCLGDGHLSKEYWCARRLHQPGQTSPDAYLGWHWCWRHLRIEGSNALCFGAHVRDVKPTDHENMVMVRADDGRYVFVHILWLLPDDVYRLHPECRRSAPAGAQ